MSEQAQTDLQSHEPVCSGLFGSIIAQSHSKRNKIFILLRSLVTKKKSLLRPANTRPLPRGSPPVRQQNTCFAAFGLRFLILMHKNTKIAYRSKRLCIRLRSGVCGGVTAPPLMPVTPEKKRLYLTDRQATGGAAISALTTSLWGRGFSRLAAGRIPCPRWGQKQRLPALVAYHTPHSLSRLNFAKCPFAHHSTLTQQNMIHFVAFDEFWAKMKPGFPFGLPGMF